MCFDLLLSLFLSSIYHRSPLAMILKSRGGSHPSSEKAWLSWLNESSSLKQRNTFEGLIRGGLYLDNLYTRALTGYCNIPCISESREDIERGSSQLRRLKSTKRKSKPIDNSSSLRSSTTSDASDRGKLSGAIRRSRSNRYDYDRSVVNHLSGCRLCARKLCGSSVKGFRDVLGSEDLAVAQATLENFDLVRRMGFGMPGCRSTLMFDLSDFESSLVLLLLHLTLSASTHFP